MVDSRNRRRWQWLRARGFVRHAVVTAAGLIVLAAGVLFLGIPGASSTGGLLVVGVSGVAFAAVFYGLTQLVDRVRRVMTHAERLNRLGLSLSSEDRAEILRAAIKAARELVEGRDVEVSIVTRNVKGELVVEATSVRRTLPYLPTVDFEALLGPSWEQMLSAQSALQRPREKLSRALAMRRTQGTVQLLPMFSEGALLGVLTIGHDAGLDRERTESILTLATLLGSALAREQLTANLAHARAESHFQSLVQNASDLIFVVRPDLSLAYASPSVERILGYSAEALATREIIALAAPEDAPALTEALQRAIDDPQPVPTLLRGDWVDQSGARHHMEVSITSRLDVPEVRGLVLNVSDVTDHAEVSEALERSQAALRQLHKLDAVGRLAGGVAHDFNNILGAITMTASSLRDDLSEAEVLQVVGELETAATRGARLTRQLLAFSRSDTSSPEMTNINEIIEGIHRMLRRLIDERVELTRDIGDTLPSVYVDRGLMEQTLMNLVVNARDALVDGRGTIVIGTTQQTLDSPRPAATGGLIPVGSYVVLSVRDDGCGMSPEVQRRIFEPFFTTKDVDKGTGLGLSMVYGIVDQSDGYIEVDSAPEEGTTFSIYLPARRGVSGAIRQAKVTTAPHGRGRLLVVEDDDILRRITARTLRRHGYEVLQAANGEDAERLFDESEQQVDLVVTDVVMPRRTGPEMVARLRQKRASLPVLYTSGYTDGVLASLGGAESLLRKPFRPAELATRVHEMLEVARRSDERRAL